ncbi:lycopene cyclase domain-containing protein [Tepidiforma sp.]|uniref:lycopene cyclase domain-containing protein n=1 Tax=Tepidiforma sp. TaxID=2682230 RepID=UPI002ADE0E0E|nr:lycopene cyclase domain-containing protein [Tepidiforma sp.]
MTYAVFLLTFVVPPMLVLAAVTARRRRGAVSQRELWAWIAGLAVVAVVYTTPWDNYLVASGTWDYDPDLVLGITLGWVPLEEYCFFVLQTVMTGLWVGLLLPREPAGGIGGVGWRAAAAAAATLLAASATFFALIVWGSEGMRYLSLIVSWAALPLALQAGFGLDLLAARWRTVALGAGVPTLWLSAADTLAIREGTWHIAEKTSTGVKLPGGLPVEELVFFLVTNLLVTCGLVLGTSPEGKARARAWLRWLRGQR